ncbi:DMT family transporter [Sediminicoccus sp. KRV36]|uniref:DMT family transporter n=1 Tax=Sediminicoccus sp. KRV36 TaxID=3133721 RepID=UPI0020103902|nr:DMT family transporter [Sediminicoccus rosea]UPY35416.1 DMT family transporter [Sediminicoccus rosea]
MNFKRHLPGLLILGVVWGLTPSVVKLALAAGIPPLGFGFWGAFGSALILSVLCASRRLRVPLDRPHIIQYSAAGLSGFALANFAGYTALQHIPAGFFALLVPLSPILTVLGAAALGMERLTPPRVLGTVLGFAGVALAMAPGAALPDPALLGWALLAALTPVCFAVSNIVAVRLAPRGTDALVLATGALYGGAFFLALFSLLRGEFHIPGQVGWPGEMLIPFQAGITAFAYLLYFRLIAATGSVITSQTGYIVPIAGVLWGAMIFGERMGWLALPAAALVFAGLWLVTAKR